MKLALLNDVVYAYAAQDPMAVGGAERQQWVLAQALAATGWSVIVGTRFGLAIGERRTIDRVEFVGVGNRQHMLVTYPRFLAAERPDWWYWQGADHWWGPIVEVARRLGVRTIFSAALDRDVLLRQALYRHPRLWPLYVWGFARVDRIFVQHSGQLAQLARRWRTKTSILPNIVEALPMVAHANREPYVAWVAMLRQVKRPDLLIEIAKKAPTLRFVVCGGTTTFMCPPGYGERIVDALRAVPNLEYRGQRSPEESHHVLANAAVLLSTSDEEGFPNTFLQAWASGTPVMSLKLDPDNCIQMQDLGTVPGSIERAVVDLRELVATPQRRQEIGERAQRYMTETYSQSAALSVFDAAVRN